MYVDLVFDQSAQTWSKLHVDAFEYFGGVPETVVPDNLKAAVVKCYFGLKDKPELNRSYRELGRHYGFMIDPTPPYASGSAPESILMSMLNLSADSIPYRFG